MYSPHNDVKRDHTKKESVIFAVREAIPRTRGVILHLTTVTPDIQKMFDATYLNGRKFLLLYSDEAEPFKEDTAEIIRADSNYRGEIEYHDEQKALDDLSSRIDDLIRNR